MDYLDSSTGYLIPPTSREHLVDGIANALLALAADPEGAKAMGTRARQVVLERFDWERKIDCVLEFYAEAIERYERTGSPGQRSIAT